MINSAIYNGHVVHKRFKPKVHYFKYKVFSLLIDLSELEILDKKVNFFSFNKFNLISFYEKDHGERYFLLDIYRWTDLLFLAKLKLKYRGQHYNTIVHQVDQLKEPVSVYQLVLLTYYTQQGQKDHYTST